MAGNLSLHQIIAARDFALAEAAKPALGQWGLWFTVVLAMVATVSGVIASTFAVSRMLAMLTDMKLVPHSHFGMPGTIQRHALIYTIVPAMLLTVFFDLSRIASLGAIFYLVMDIAIRWGVLRHLRRDVGANAAVLTAAILLDVIVLGAFQTSKWQSGPVVIVISIIGTILIVAAERLFLHMRLEQDAARHELH